MKIYNTFTLPTLLHGCETWAIREHDKSKIHQCKWNLWELKIKPGVKKIQNYKNMWIQ